MAVLICQQWEESEAGWGIRPDGYSLHRSLEDARVYVQAHRARQIMAREGKPPGWVPPVYTRTDGEPFQVLITDEAVLERLNASEHGIRGPGRRPPPKYDPPKEEVCEHPRVFSFTAKPDDRCGGKWHDGADWYGPIPRLSGLSGGDGYIGARICVDCHRILGLLTEEILAAAVANREG